MRKLVECIAELHASGIAHLDIKIENFVVCENFIISLIDFGLSGPLSWTNGF